ncbi:MAG: hypothetical protein ABID38_00700 [Candidatus Diapherotrites archaeon]
MEFVQPQYHSLLQELQNCKSSRQRNVVGMRIKKLATQDKKIRGVLEPILRKGEEHSKLKIEAYNILAMPFLTNEQKLELLNEIARISEISHKLSENQGASLQEMINMFEEENIHEGRIKLKK